MINQVANMKKLKFHQTLLDNLCLLSMMVPMMWEGVYVSICKIGQNSLREELAYRLGHLIKFALQCSLMVPDIEFRNFLHLGRVVPFAVDMRLDVEFLVKMLNTEMMKLDMNRRDGKTWKNSIHQFLAVATDKDGYFVLVGGRHLMAQSPTLLVTCDSNAPDLFEKKLHLGCSNS